MACRAHLLQGWHDEAVSTAGTATTRCTSWNTGSKNAKTASGVLKVLLALILLLTVLLLSHNRSQQYLHNRQRRPATIIHRTRLSLAALQSNQTADSPWLPPTWFGEPPALDPLACTPQLLVIGGMKCGTTALFYYLNGTKARSPQNQQFLNGTPASAEYCNKTFSQPDEQRRFHPELVGSMLTKEVHFFDRNPEHVKNHTSDYFAKFPGVNMTVDDPGRGVCSYPQQLGLSKDSRPALVRMEATPSYMPTRTAPVLVKDILPSVRLLAILREPVTRAISSINMVIQQGDFPELKVLRKSTPQYGRMWREVVVRELHMEMFIVGHCFGKRDTDMGHGVVEPVDACVLSFSNKLNSLGQSARRFPRVLDIYLGLYALHLQRWFVAGFVPEQMLIWSTKAFEETPWHHMRQLVRWLGLDPSRCKQRGDFLKLHKRSYPDGTLPRGFLQEVAAFYQPHNQQLFQLLTKLGYHELVQQLQTAWPLELAATIDKLEETEVPAMPIQ